jgi:hypothetical protein
MLCAAGTNLPAIWLIRIGFVTTEKARCGGQVRRCAGMAGKRALTTGRTEPRRTRRQSGLCGSNRCKSWPVRSPVKLLSSCRLRKRYRGGNLLRRFPMGPSIRFFTFSELTHNGRIRCLPRELMEQKGIVEARKCDLKSDKAAASESFWDRLMRACRFTESGNRGEGATHLGQPELSGRRLTSML